MKKSLIILLAFIFIDSYSQSRKPTDVNSKTEYSILFIGNSLTYTNDLPKLVNKSAKSKGIEIHSEIIAFPNYALEDHWNDGQIQQLIASNKYDYVIVQQGPSSQEEGRKMLLAYGEKISSLCKTHGAKLCFFMVWPSLQYYQTFDGVIKNYEEAAILSNSILLPVGEVWKDYFDTTNNFKYYGPDGFHPSLIGSKTAAELIVNYLFLQHEENE